MDQYIQELLDAGVPFIIEDEYEVKERIRLMVNRAERLAEKKVRKGLMSWEAFMALPEVLERKLRKAFGVIGGYNPDIPMVTEQDDRTCLDPGMLPDPDFEVEAYKSWPQFSYKRLVKMACGQKAEVWHLAPDGSWELLRTLARIQHPMRNSTGNVVGRWTIVPNYSLWFGWFRGNLHVVYRHGGKVYRAEVSYAKATKSVTVVREWEVTDELPEFNPALASLT